jgi:RNA polymerase sigma factor (sigma-70 family)
MSNTTNLDAEWEFWYPRVYGYFYKRIADKIEVEDLTANTLSTVFLAKDVVNVKGYLWKVAHNYLVKYIKTKSKAPIIVSWNENQNWIPEESSLALEDQAVSDVHRTKMKNLKICIDNQISSASDRNLIQLSIYEEKNSTEIGNQLNLKSGTVRQKLARLLLKIKTHCTSLWSS